MNSKSTNTAVTLSLIALFILISGCVQKDVPQKQFIASDDALVMSFQAGSPPDKVFSDSEFDIVLQAENKGEHGLALGDVRFVLTDAGFSNGQSEIMSNSQIIAPASQAISGEYLAGGIEFANWNGMKYASVMQVTEMKKIPARVEACYPYETKASATLCVKAGTTAKCSDDEEKTVANSGAPVKITEFSQIGSTKTATGVQTGFKFKVARTGGEEYKFYSNVADCPTLSAINANIINVAVDMPKTTCSPTTAILDSKTQESDSITCTISFDTTSSFEKVIPIKLNYVIKQSTNKDIQIIPLPK